MAKVTSDEQNLGTSSQAFLLEISDAYEFDALSVSALLTHQGFDCGSALSCNIFDAANGELTRAALEEALRALNGSMLFNSAKVLVIKQAEHLPKLIANALLKTIEELPPRTFIILLTANPLRVLPTVRSRLIQLSRTQSAPLDKDEIASAKAKSNDQVLIALTKARHGLGNALAAELLNLINRENLIEALNTISNFYRSRLTIDQEIAGEGYAIGIRFLNLAQTNVHFELLKMNLVIALAALY